MLSSEKEDVVKWALQTFINYFQSCPKIICTDSCPTLGKVIQDLMPETKHLLCAWHVEKNLLKKIRCISKSYFLTIMNLIYLESKDKELAKEIPNLPYTNSITSFKKTFESIFKLDLSTDIMDYFKKKYKLKEKWVFCFKKVLPCLKVNTTSRIEGLNSLIKALISLSLASQN